MNDLTRDAPAGLNTWQFEALKQIANVLAIRYMAEFYLVGSFIHKGAAASDIDIIMVVSEKRIKHLFGDTKWNDKWKHLYWKQKKNIEQTIYDMDIDFKVQTYKEFNAVDLIKIKLDSEVEPMVEASKSSAEAISEDEKDKRIKELEELVTECDDLMPVEECYCDKDNGHICFRCKLDAEARYISRSNKK